MFFGKVENTEDWGFNIKESIFSESKEISDEDYKNLLKEAQKQNKWIEPDENGNPVLVDPPEPSRESIINNRIGELEAYLTSTDWYAIRFADTGEEIPADVKKKRQQAREEISELRNS